MTETAAGAAAAAAIADQIRLRRRLPAPSMRRALREQSDLTAADLAVALGVTRQAVSKWERGLRTPRGDHLEAYVAVLDQLATERTDPSPSDVGQHPGARPVGDHGRGAA